MVGDKLFIKNFHTKAAQFILGIIIPLIEQKKGKFILSIAGESGSGKSEIASEISRLLEAKSFKTHILQQDDYFIYPPKTNEKMRKLNIHHVGLSEVKLDVLDKNLSEILQSLKKIHKPLVIFDEDRITEETVNTFGIDAFIIEGTYTTLLKSVDIRVFIDRSYLYTKKSRLERAREEQDDFLEKVLNIEHKTISQHKTKADIIVRRDYSVESRLF